MRSERVNLERYLSGKGKAPKGITKEWLYFCELDIKSGKLWAGDPNLPNEDDGYAAKVPRGTYVVEGVGSRVGGDRIVSRLRVRLRSAPNPTLGKELGDTGTDSSTIGVCDIAPFEKAYKVDGGAEAVQDAIDALDGESFGILKVPAFADATMAFVPTGSDGTGPVFALMSDGKRVGIELAFMDEGDVA
jgi:hypothetical protein